MDRNGHSQFWSGAVKKSSVAAGLVMDIESRALKRAQYRFRSKHR